MSTPQRSKLLHSLRGWKAKAIARRQENNALKKRIVELTHSRDAWKVTAQTSQAKVAECQTEHRPEKKPAPHAIVIASRQSRP